ncbi:MAG: calcium/sodium antiporter [Planctomycetes bacterium]|nr:calcium/sodium antiporter [Planctomycetota bacterium]
MLALLADRSWAANLPIVGILAGLVLLVVGAELLVRGAVWIALTLGVSRMTVGLTLVAFGTSMPELLVSFTAAANGNSEIAMANVIGSNTFNILFIVGLAAAIRPIRLRVEWMELGYMLVATALAAVPFLYGAQVGRPIAGVMVAMLVLFCTQLVMRERSKAGSTADRPEDHPRSTLVGWLTNLALVAMGLALLKFGADWLIDGSVAIAQSLGMSQALIGMTIVAVGTSLPELATSAMAARKGQPEIALGNVIGSNVFNIGSVLGVSGLLQPFPVNVPALAALMIATAVSAIWLTVVLRARGGVSRPVGAAFLLSYVAYIGWEAWRTGAI